MRLQVILVSAAVAGLCVFAAAEVKLHRLFSDHAVLQRDVTIPVWGTADAGEQVTVSIGNDQTIATTDAQGNWIVRLPKRPASAEPVKIIVTGKNQITIRDVLIGDVWLASGQSNMDMAFFWSEKGKEAAKTVNSPLVRIFRVASAPADAPQTALSRGSWGICVQSASTQYLPQLGYYFGRELQQKLGIPIGIINSACSGTSIQAWMSPEALATDPAGIAIQQRWRKTLDEFPARKAKYEIAKTAWDTEKAAAIAAGNPFTKSAPPVPSKPGGTQAPSGLYNSMIHPLAPCAIRGIIWYQGENNTKDPARYRTLFPSLIQSWRAAFSRNELPFYWVQLPGYNMGTEYGDDWAGLREAQTMALSLHHTGQAVTIDIGEAGNVHPNNKPEVARRLALLALGRTYGDQTVVDCGPVFDRAEFDGGTARIHFKHVAAGLKNKADDYTKALAGFEVAADDGVFHPAEARIDGATNTVLVTSSKVPMPAAVRYAWRNCPTGLTLCNSEGLPLAPFRTGAPASNQGPR